MPFTTGTRVRIKATRFGMSEFDGSEGTVVGHEKDGQTTLHRVKLDKPVKIPSVGMVSDDLWSKDHLEEID